MEQYNQSSPFLFDSFCTGVVSVFPPKSSYEADINELNFMWSHVRFPSRIIWALMLAELSDGCLATIQIIFYAGVALTEDDYVLQSVDHPANPSFFLITWQKNVNKRSRVKDFYKQIWLCFVFLLLTCLHTAWITPFSKQQDRFQTRDTFFSHLSVVKIKGPSNYQEWIFVLLV